MIKKDLLAFAHRAQVFSGLVIPHAIPAGDRFAAQVFNRENIRLGFHEPVGHAFFFGMEKVPADGGGLGSRTLAKQGGRFPVTSGSSCTRTWDDHNSDTRAATWGSYRFGKYEPGRSPQGPSSF